MGPQLHPARPPPRRDGISTRRSGGQTRPIGPSRRPPRYARAGRKGFSGRNFPLRFGYAQDFQPPTSRIIKADQADQGLPPAAPRTDPALARRSPGTAVGEPGRFAPVAGSRPRSVAIAKWRRARGRGGRAWSGEPAHELASPRARRRRDRAHGTQTAARPDAAAREWSAGPGASLRAR